MPKIKLIYITSLLLMAILVQANINAYNEAEDTFSYFSYLSPKNVSDAVFKYYSPINEQWIGSWYPDLKIEWLYDIADALYKNFMTFNNSRFSECLYTIVYLASLFDGEKYLDPAERYWDFVYTYAVNHNTYFMKTSADSSNAGIDVEMWSLYMLWKLTKKEKYLYNLSSLINIYEDLVLQKIGIPLSSSLKISITYNNTEIVIDIDNNSKELITWRSSVYGILILLAEHNLLNKSLLAMSLHNLLDILYWEETRALYDGIRISVIREGNIIRYSFLPYSYFRLPRQHPQRILPFLWAQRQVYKESTEQILKTLSESLYERFYEPSRKTIIYGPWSEKDVEQYGIVPIYSMYFLNKTNISDLLNSSLLMYITGPTKPVLWWTKKKLGVKHSVKVMMDIDKGKYDVDYGTNEYRVYVHIQTYKMLQRLIFLTNTYWMLHNPHYYYAISILYNLSAKKDGYYDYYCTRWRKGFGFAVQQGSDLFVLYDGAHPKYSFYQNAILQCGNCIMSEPRLRISPTYTSSGLKSFDIKLINIEIPHNRTSYIFIPSSYHVKSIKIQNGAIEKTAIIGDNNYSFICDDYYNFSFSALPDNVIIFNPQNASRKDIIVNITIRMLYYNPPNWYKINTHSGISYAYWLTYHKLGEKLVPDDDPDNDGVINRYEVLFFSDPYDFDTDDDGLDDGEEIYFLINPVSKDADCDGLGDRFELYGVTIWSKYIRHEFNPRDSSSYNRSYSDIFYGYILENQTKNIVNWDEYKYNETAFRNLIDTDRDSVSNLQEIINGTDPFHPEKNIEPKNMSNIILFLLVVSVQLLMI